MPLLLVPEVEPLELAPLDPPLDPAVPLDPLELAPLDAPLVPAEPLLPPAVPEEAPLPPLLVDPLDPPCGEPFDELLPAQATAARPTTSARDPPPKVRKVRFIGAK
jgi:hypothetical protein